MEEDYEVQAGDCISSIAYERGFSLETIWNHPANAALKQRRRNPYVLRPGDVLKIPDKTEHLESCQTERGTPSSSRESPQSFASALWTTKTCRGQISPIHCLSMDRLNPVKPTMTA